MKLTNNMRDIFVNAAMQDVPAIDYMEQMNAAALKVCIDALPPKIRAIWNDKELRGFLRTQSVGLAGHMFQLPAYTYEYKAAVLAAIVPISEKHDGQEATRRSLRNKLRSVATACSTRKALAEALPEFEKYLPADEPAANRSMPVVTGVVTEFIKAGWPKGTAKKAKARP